MSDKLRPNFNVAAQRPKFNVVAQRPNFKTAETGTSDGPTVLGLTPLGAAGVAFVALGVTWFISRARK